MPALNFSNRSGPRLSNPSEVTDAELVERAQAGDTAAFGVIVDRYQHVVVRAAMAVVGRRDEAEDVAQDAFLRAYRALAGFRGEASLKTWLLTITWRQALSHRRSLVVWLRRFGSSADEFPEVNEWLTNFRMVVNGKELHHATLIKLEEGKTFDDLMAGMKAMKPGTL